MNASRMRTALRPAMHVRNERTDGLTQTLQDQGDHPHLSQRAGRKRRSAPGNPTHHRRERTMTTNRIDIVDTTTGTTLRSGPDYGHYERDENGFVQFVVDFTDPELVPAQTLEEHADEQAGDNDRSAWPHDLTDDATVTTDAPCGTCDGEGFTDDNEDLSERAPWSFWTALTPPSDMAVRLGLVKRVACYACTPAPTTPVEG